MVLLDLKVNRNYQAFGEFCIHLEHLGADLKSSPIKGMLFSKSEFALYEQQNGVPISYLSGHWNDNGSIHAIRTFFESVLGPFGDIDTICSGLRVRAQDPQFFEGCVSGFLGQGGSGRVIRVLLGGDLNNAAIKFMRSESLVALFDESSRLRKYASSCKCTIIDNAVSEVIQSKYLCCFVLSPLGKTCTRQMVLEQEIPPFYSCVGSLIWSTLPLTSNISW